MHVITLVPLALEYDCMYCKPSAPLMLISSGVVTDRITIAAVAPGYCDVTVTVGGEICGYCATGSAGIVIEAGEQYDEAQHAREKRASQEELDHYDRIQRAERLFLVLALARSLDAPTIRVPRRQECVGCEAAQSLRDTRRCNRR